MNNNNIQSTLTQNTEPTDWHALAEELIQELTLVSPDVREGTVMTMGPVPYRRLDCDRRALAYVRARPRKGMVRVDISGLWLLPRDSPLATSSSGATKTLVLRCAADKTEAISFLLAIVEATRVQQARIREREAQRRARDREIRAQIRRSRGIRSRPPRTGPAAVPNVAIAAEAQSTG